MMVLLWNGLGNYGKTAVGAGGSRHRDADGSGSAQGAGTRGGGGTGSQNVVNEKDVFACEPAAGGKGGGDVFAARRIAQTGLRGCEAPAPKGVDDRNAPFARHPGRQQPRLVKAALPP